MKPQEKLRLLKSIRLLDQIPERQLEGLSEFLSPVAYADGAVIFDEGTRGDSLFFVTGGGVRIAKKVSSGELKDLAILGPGECFGEMALVEDVTRSARASACGQTSLMRLHRDDMNRWLRSHPELALDFFAELVQLLSRRLRRTSRELTLLFDLSQLLLEAPASGREFLSRVLAHVVPHLEGTWSAAAYLYNMFNDEMDLVAACGPSEVARLVKKLPPPEETRPLWLDDRVFYVSLPGTRRPHGYLLFHSEAGLGDEERAETGRTLTAVARLITSALENINYRVDESLRQRLKERAPHGADL